MTNKKLYDLLEKFEKISKLFGLEINVYPNFNNECYAEIQKQEIHIAYNMPLTQVDFIEALVFENIDKFHSNKHKEKYINAPAILKFFLHEVGHLVTMNIQDVIFYKMEKEETFTDEIKATSTLHQFNVLYRKMTYEKIADALSSELLYYNYDAIMKILLNKRVRITNKRIENNKRIAKQIKGKYIKN